MTWTAPGVQVEWLWECIGAMSDKVRGEFLFWLTGLRRIPAGGFAGLHHTLIRLTSASGDHLPVAHSCSFQLDLPKHDSREQLATKLYDAIRHTNFGIL